MKGSNKGARKQRQLERKARRKANRFFFAVGVFVFLFCGIILAHVGGLKKERDILKEEKAFYEMRIEAEKQKEQDLREEGEYMKTKRFVEQLAKEKLGLVNPNEVIIKANN